jgi:hypothetical protein
MPVVAVGLVDVVTAGAAARTAACRRGCRHLGPSCLPRTGFAGCRVETDRRGNAVGRDRNAGSPLSRNRHSGFRRGWRRPGGHASECIEARLAARLRPCRSRRTNPAGWRAGRRLGGRQRAPCDAPPGTVPPAAQQPQGPPRANYRRRLLRASCPHSAAMLPPPEPQSPAARTPPAVPATPTIPPGVVVATGHGRRRRDLNLHPSAAERAVS